MSKDIITIEHENQEPSRQTKKSKIHEIRTLLIKNFGSLNPYQDNPYLTRKIRQDSRNGRPALSVAFPTIFTLAVFWLTMHFLGPSVKHPMGYQWRYYPGMSIAKILAIFATMFYGLSAIFVASMRANKFHQEETASNTFEQLIILPQKPSEHLYKIAIHPFLVGMMIAISALPFYIIVWGMGGIDLWQLISIYLYFAYCSLIFPTVSYLNARYAVYQSNKPVTTEVNKRKQGSIAGLAWIFVWAGSRIIFSTFGKPITNALSWLFQQLTPIFQELSAPLAAYFGFIWYIMIKLFPNWLISIALIMIYPYPFYGLHIPPVVLFLPLMLAGRILHLLWINRRVEFDETGVTVWDSRLGRWRAATSLLKTIVLMGYLWQPMILHGNLSWIIDPKHQSAATSQAGLLWILLSVALLISFIRAQSTNLYIDQHTKSVTEQSMRWKDVFSPIGWVWAIYLITHLLAWRWPFPASVQTLCIQFVLAAVAIAPLAWGLQRLRRALFLLAFRENQQDQSSQPWKIPNYRTWHYSITQGRNDLTRAAMVVPGRFLRRITLLGYLIVIGTFISPLLVIASAQTGQLQSLALLSPFGTIISMAASTKGLFNAMMQGNLNISIPSWKWALLYQPCLGLILMGITQVYGANQERIAKKETRHRAPSSFKRAQEQASLGFYERLFGRLDNAIVTRELRWMARKGILLVRTVIGLFGYPIVIFLQGTDFATIGNQEIAHYLFPSITTYDASFVLSPMVFLLGFYTLMMTFLPNNICFFSGKNSVAPH